MSQRVWGWWQQVQSGEYRKTPKLSQGTPSPSITKTTIPQNSSAISTLYNAQFRSLANTNNQLRPSLSNAIKKPQIKEPQITIAEIRKMLNGSYDGNKLQELLSSALNKLKEIYKTNKYGFSKKDIVFLRNVSNINNSLILLIKTKEKLVQEILQFRKQYPNS
jgi:hypothetical protein